MQRTCRGRGQNQPSSWFLLEPRLPQHVGQKVSLGRHREHKCVHDKCLLKSYSGVQTGTGGLGGGHSPSRQDTGTGSLSPCWDLWCLKGWLRAEREGAQMSLWAVAVRRLLTIDLDRSRGWKVAGAPRSAGWQRIAGVHHSSPASSARTGSGHVSCLCLHDVISLYPTTLVTITEKTHKKLVRADWTLELARCLHVGISGA